MCEKVKIKLAIFGEPAILFPVMRDTMKEEKIKILNATFNLKRHPNYTGNHDLARSNTTKGTFSIGTTEAEMVSEFLAETVGKDINGKTWTNGEIVQVVSVDFFEDSFIKGRFHKDNY